MSEATTQRSGFGFRVVHSYDGDLWEIFERAETRAKETFLCHVHSAEEARRLVKTLNRLDRETSAVAEGEIE